MSFISPAPDSTSERVDQGKDYGSVRGNIVAVARGVISNVYQNLSGFGYTIIEKVSGGSSVYYGLETGGDPIGIRPGQAVAQGQTVARGRSSGGIEVGYWNPATGRPIGQGAFPTQAGLDFVSRIRGGNAIDTNVPGYVPAQYVPWVKTASQDTGLPGPIVAAQINDESGFNARATSPTGAKGVAQFEPGTFSRYGTGDPYNPQDALGAYVNYMNTLLSQYNGNIRNALAAYNAGSGNIQAGYGYADAILAKAGAPRTATAGSPSSFGGTRPGGQPANGGGDSGAAVTQLFTDYEATLTTPRTAPASTFTAPGQAGWSAPLQWWWQSFSGRYAQETQDNAG